jgi:TatD DNase family protein
MNSEIRFIDTHAHMYDEAFISEIDVFVSKAQQQHVAEIYLPNCDRHTITPMMQIVEMYPEVFKPMMGLHPCYVKDDYEAELLIVKEWLDKYNFAAIGEIGLDYYWDQTYVTQQKAAFELQTDWALDKKLPVIIHTRNSIDDGIAIISQKQNGNLKGIFHCFSGTLEQAKKIVDLGFYLGIGGVVTYKKSELPLIVEQIALDHLVVETDAPYLAPMPYRGKTNESAYIPIVAQKIADIKQISLEQVATQTTINARNIFKY